MSDNPQSVSSPLLALPGHRVVTLSGRDALPFAQAQFMNDVNALSDGEWQWNGWLTPKGRVLALFALLRVDAETLWLLLPDADAATMAESLRRYLFRSKVVLDVVGSLPVAGSFSVPEQARNAQSARLADGSIELDMSGDGGPRRLCIGVAAAVDATHADRWHDADLAHGLPRLDAAQVEQWTPQQLSLERLKAFSVKKGCYPGQEIVARTHFLGKAKRGLACFQADRPIPADSDISAGDRSIGTVVSISSDGSHCLAVLPLDRDATPLTVGSTPLSPRDLLGGLGR